MSAPILAIEDNTVQGTWVGLPGGVVANKLGTSSVVAIFNKERCWVCNLTSDRYRMELVNTMYEESKGLFHNGKVDVWIVYAQQNAQQGQNIVNFFKQRGPVTCIFRQVYDGDSFLDNGAEEGAQVRVQLVGGTVHATLGRQDGVGAHFPLQNGKTAVFTGSGIVFR
ncbi:hypothetical protein N7491_000166 [Penicillium cf. griseofulvum]|uniref:Uncharacterized protein n=1 Tax=Penicillium cf. griseofulvum TaxID=2972120 RepID=A0A9W9JMS5_9EURO|nr:hypothetical protein N7472_004481 [Penicillium cf. griseofulvum]KAJ5450984.1 hypothetical protein N7491_000166 [Penicillium cf. griseofulvum]